MSNLLHSIQMARAILKIKFLRRHKILTVQIILNYKCNLQCLYCFAPRSNEEMEFNKVKDILFLLKKEGTLQISFSGGEPTIHPDYHKIIHLSRKLGFFIVVATNGIDRDLILPGNKDSIPHSVVVSLDGPSEVHELYRGNGTFEKVNETLEALKGHRIHTTLFTVIGRHNCNLENIQWLINRAEELNANFIFQFMLPKFDSRSSVNPLAPDIQQIKVLIKGILRIPRIQRESFIYNDDVLRQLMTWDSLVPYYHMIKGKRCLAGRNFALISPSYILAPCTLLEDHPWFEANDIFEEGLKECLKRIQKIPCNDCYLACNLLRNNILNLNPRISCQILKKLLLK